MRLRTPFPAKFLLALLFILPAGCSDPAAEAPVLNLDFVAETSITITWTMESMEELKSLTAYISMDVDFSESIREIEITGGYDQEQMKIDNLRGATRYYCKLVAVLLNNKILESNVIEVTTTFQTEKIHLTTKDRVTLACEVYYLAGNSSLRPGLIFMHGLGEDHHSWKQTPLLRRLIAGGYVCLAFDFRGHGGSSPWAVPPPLDNDPHKSEKYMKEASLDLLAALSALRNHDRANPQKIGLLGMMLGGTMALAGNTQQSVKVSVAISPSLTGVRCLDKKLVVDNVLFIVGDNHYHDLWDDNFSAPPKKIMFVFNDYEKGWPLLNGAGVKEGIIEWIDTRFEKYCQAPRKDK